MLNIDFLTESRNACSISRGSKTFATGHRNGMIIIWENDSHKPIHILNEHKSCVYSVSIGPNNKYIASGSKDYTAKLWDMKSGDCIHTFVGHDDYISSVSLKSNYLATGSYDHTAKLWDIRSKKLILGTWQGVYLFEHRLNNQNRTILIHILGN